MTPDAPEVSVRRLRGEDRAAWDPLWQGYLEFYDETVDPEVTDVVFQRLTDPGWTAQFAVVAEVEGRLLGFAHLLEHPSTWSEAPDCYLEDLFVDPDARGNGIASALFEHLCSAGEEAGWRKIHWTADTDNATARRLYDAVGELQDLVRYEIRFA